MEIYGNKDTFNVESVLRQNIINSDYYRNTCVALTCWEDLIDEVYESVQHVEPWMSGNARGASSAFCLLYRLFALRMSPAELRQTLEHKDSPYIRAVGLLYVRYVCDPKSLWQWFERYVDDPEEVLPSEAGTTVTIGDYARDLLLDQFYFETIFPRIPKKISDDIVDSLKARGLPATHKGNGGQGGRDRRGDDSGNRRPASVKASLSVAFGQRAPNRAGAREEGRGRDPSAHERARDDGRGDRRPEPQRRVEADRGRDRDYARDGRDWHREADRQGYKQRDDGRYRSRSADEYRRPRSRSPDRRASGRDARDVFRESAGGRYDSTDLRERYGHSSSTKLFDDERQRRDYRDDGYRSSAHRR